MLQSITIPAIPKIFNGPHEIFAHGVMNHGQFFSIIKIKNSIADREISFVRRGNEIIFIIQHLVPVCMQDVLQGYLFKIISYTFLHNCFTLFEGPIITPH